MRPSLRGWLTLLIVTLWCRAEAARGAPARREAGQSCPARPGSDGIRCGRRDRAGQPALRHLHRQRPQASCRTRRARGRRAVTGFSCEAVLPAMTSGQHTIQLASYISVRCCSRVPKSAPLVITVAGGGAITAGGSTARGGGFVAVVSAPRQVRDFVTSDGTTLHAAVVAAIVQPAALAVAGDGDDRRRGSPRHGECRA